MTPLEEYYNKFNEDKRLDTRHGQVEFLTSMKYIHDCIEVQKQRRPEGSSISILDIGAGTGRYSIPLFREGYDVTAVELVRHNLGRLRKKESRIQAYQGNAIKLSRFSDDIFDIALLFGPMYHLHTREEKLQALLEAKRVTRPGGFILVAYYMNEYSVITYAFKERHILEAVRDGMLDEDYHCTQKANPLYSMVRPEDIQQLNKEAGMKRYKIVAADGPADYMRQTLHGLNEEEFAYFMKYHLSTCEREDLLGASAHTLDILEKC